MMASLRNKLEGIASESKLSSIGKIMGLGDKSADAAKAGDAATDAAAGASKIEVPPSSGGGARDPGQQARMQQLSNPNPAVATANDPFNLAPGAIRKQADGAAGAGSGTAKAGDNAAGAGSGTAKAGDNAAGMTTTQKRAGAAGAIGLAGLAGLAGGDTQQTTPPAPGGSANPPGGSTAPAKPPKPTAPAAPTAPAGSPELDELDAIARELAQSQEPLAIELMGQYNALRSKLGKAKEMPNELEEMIRLIKY